MNKNNTSRNDITRKVGNSSMDTILLSSLPVHDMLRAKNRNTAEGRTSVL